MQSTVTDLTQDLRNRLERAGMNPGDAQAVTDLLPPAGQRDLIAELRDNPNALAELAQTHPAKLAQRFGTTTAVADQVRTLLAVAR